MAVEASIADALQRRLSLFQHTPELPIAWPGLPFTPPSGPHLVASFMPNRTDNLFVGNRASVRFQGLFQITVVWPAGQGVIQPMRVAERLVEHFAKGTEMQTPTIPVRVEERPSIAPPLQEPSHLRIPVTVRYRAFSR